MADLTILHHASDNHEILLNRDQILYAEQADQTTTTVFLPDNKFVHVKDAVVGCSDRGRSSSF
jgi:hypothetical protein